MADLAKFMECIKGATTAELHTFKELMDNQLKASFKVGNRVSFTGRYGNLETGKVIKVNPKLVVVKVNSGMTWRVHPSLLTKI